jgi:adenylate cyclase
LALPLPEKPSVAVMPFANLSSDAAQDLISEGLTESLVNALARSPFLFLIAHSSTSHYAGRPVAAKRAAEELGVRYIVEGSVKREGDRVRVTTQLVDTLTSKVLWSERYDRTTDDLLAVEDEITTRIARTLDIRITYGSEALAGGTRRLDAWTAFVEGRSEYLKFARGGNLRAREHYQRALRLDPNYAEAMVAIAHTHLLDLVDAPKAQWGSVLAEIEELEREAARIAPRMPRLLQLRSLLALMRGDYDVALAEAEAMVELDPNGAESHMALGRTCFFTGQYERAIGSLKAAERIDPHSRASYAFHSALSHLALRNNDAAVSILNTVAERWPGFAPARAFLAIAYQLAGRSAEARQQVARLPRDDPAATMRAIERVFSAMRDRTAAARIVEAARQAGFPD